VHRRVTRGVRRLTQRYHVTRVMSRETGNMVMKVDVKENVEEGPMKANTGLLEAWVRQIRSPVRQIRLLGCPRHV
jgi:uncharacterized protein YggU (UPF0235/DUF167 family)